MIYEVRSNCEYVMRVEAESPQAAIAKAEAIDFNEPEWDESWAPITAEPVDATEVSAL